MGQSVSSSQANPSNDEGIVDAAERHEPRCAGRANPLARKMQDELYTPNFPPLASGAGTAGVDSSTCAVGSHGNASDSAAAIPIFCLDASEQNMCQLFKWLELPPAQRAKVLQEVSKNVCGVLLHAPATTSVGDLRQFLLGQCPLRQRTPDKSALSPHLLAIRDPFLSSAGGAAANGTPSGGSAKAFSNSLLTLPDSMVLSTLSMNKQLFFLPGVGASEADCNQLATGHASVGAADSYPAALGREDAEAEKAAAASPSACADDVSTAGRALVLLYSYEPSFGIDCDDILLLGCCASLCACIAASICCCMNAQKDRSPSNVDTMPSSNNGGNGVPNYYNPGNGTSYCAPPPPPPQPPLNYYEAPGYDMPPNTYPSANPYPVYQPQSL
nr:unnamed protein product [Leishmania braziliensis]